MTGLGVGGGSHRCEWEGGNGVKTRALEMLLRFFGTAQDMEFFLSDDRQNFMVRKIKGMPLVTYRKCPPPPQASDKSSYDDIPSMNDTPALSHTPFQASETYIVRPDPRRVRFSNQQ